MDQRTARIRALNDQLRVNGTGGQVMATAGVNGRGAAFVQAAATAVRAFNSFDKANDPHCEHDFGAVEVEGAKLFWKIDYYTPGLEAGSEDPSDAAKTVRVLTIMLAEEY